MLGNQLVDLTIKSRLKTMNLRARLLIWKSLSTFTRTTARSILEFLRETRTRGSNKQMIFWPKQRTRETKSRSPWGPKLTLEGPRIERLKFQTSRLAKRSPSKEMPMVTSKAPKDSTTGCSFNSKRT